MTVLRNKFPGSGKKTDLRGVPYAVGQIVVRPTAIGYQKISTKVVTVSKIENGRIYFSSSPQPVKFPERCVIVEILPPIPTKE